MVTKQEITKALHEIGDVLEGEITPFWPKPNENKESITYNTWVIKDPLGGNKNMAMLALPKQDCYDIDLQDIVSQGKKKYENLSSGSN